MRTWHAEAVVIGTMLALAWAVDQVVAGAVDSWSIPALLLVYIGTRQASIADRKREVTPPGRLDLIHCLREGKRYDLAAYAVGLVMAAKPLLASSWETLRHGAAFAPASAGALALVGFTVRVLYPVWRKAYRRRHPSGGIYQSPPCQHWSPESKPISWRDLVKRDGSQLRPGDSFAHGRVTTVFIGEMSTGRTEWMAFITGDRRYWAKGQTEAEAIGYLTKDHADQLFNSAAVAPVETAYIGTARVGKRAAMEEAAREATARGERVFIVGGLDHVCLLAGETLFRFSGEPPPSDSVEPRIADAIWQAQRQETMPHIFKPNPYARDFCLSCGRMAAWPKHQATAPVEAAVP